MPTQTLKREILLAALAGFQLDKQRIDAQIAEVQAMLDGEVPQKASSVAEEAPKHGRRRKFSAAVRRRMAEAQKARWAAIKGAAETPAPVMAEAPKKKRQISAEGMKNIIAATKKRWRLQKAAQATQSTPAQKAASKKSAVKKAPTKVATKKVAVKRVATKKTAPALVQAVAQTGV